MSGIADWHRNLRAEIGEEAYREKLAAIRARRKVFGGAFRLDYVDKDGRTGSQIAADAGRKGAQMRSKQN